MNPAVLLGPLMWLPSETPVTNYTVQVWGTIGGERVLANLWHPVEPFLTYEELTFQLKPGRYSVTITGGTVNETNFTFYHKVPPPPTGVVIIQPPPDGN